MHRTNIPVVILLFLSLSTLWAQQDSVTAPPSTAITFAFSGLNLGGGIGGKLALGNDFIFRPEVRFDFHKTDDDRPMVDGQYRSSSASSSVTVMTSFEKHFPVSRTLSPYCGLSSGATWSQLRQTTESNFGKSSGTEKWWIIQGGVLIGVEYWITGHISLAGEQMVFATFRWSHDRHQKYVELRNSTSLLLLSVYF